MKRNAFLLLYCVFALSACSRSSQFPVLHVAGRMVVTDVKHWPTRKICDVDEGASQRFISYLARMYPNDWARLSYFVDPAPTYKLQLQDIKIEILRKGIVIYVYGIFYGVDATAHSLKEGESEALIEIACVQRVAPEGL